MNGAPARTRRVLPAHGLLRAALILSVLAAASPASGQYLPDDRNSCRSCHIDARNKTDFCALFEATIYERDDKHGRAFFLLHETDPRDPSKGQAKRDLVRQILGFELREAFADEGYTRLIAAADEAAERKVATVKSCLRCHATWPATAAAQSPTEPPVALELGVSCQACHGPGEKWFLPHQRAPFAWRAVTPAAKAALGFTDVRAPEQKARLCASCHVGSVAEGKLIKHEWYAAGHPPLPSFELASFEAQMPVHWQPLSAKPSFALRDGELARDDARLADNLRSLQAAGIPPEAIRANYLGANFPTNPQAGHDLPRTKDTIVSAASVLGSYARMVGDYAALAAENKAPWPELALYDCAACHHELRSGLGAGTRPRRSHAPGRPPLSTWPIVLAQLAARQAEGYDKNKAEARWSAIDKLLLQLDRATTNRPFGDPSAMRDAAKSLSAALTQLTNDAANTRYDEAAARNALTFLTDPAHYEINDYSTARQAAWALSEISKDLKFSGANQLFLAGTEDPLALKLPSGQGSSVMENLHRCLPAAERYDPKWFQRQLQGIRPIADKR